VSPSDETGPSPYVTAGETFPQRTAPKEQPPRKLSGKRTAATSTRWRVLGKMSNRRRSKRSLERSWEPAKTLRF
jgi:hypothetical protein